MNTGIVFHFANQRPVCFSFIQLTTGAAMNSQGLHTNILHALGHFFNIFRSVVPAESCFNGYRQACAFYNGFGKPHHQRYIF